MNSPCEGGAKKGAAIFYAQTLFRYCAHKLYAPERPAEPPPKPVCTCSPLCEGCPYANKKIEELDTRRQTNGTYISTCLTVFR